MKLTFKRTGYAIILLCDFYERIYEHLYVAQFQLTHETQKVSGDILNHKSSGGNFCRSTSKCCDIYIKGLILMAIASHLYTCAHSSAESILDYLCL